MYFSDFFKIINVRYNNCSNVTFNKKKKKKIIFPNLIRLDYNIDVWESKNHKQIIVFFVFFFFFFWFYLFNVKLDATTTLVQKHKIVVLRKRCIASGSSSPYERGEIRVSLYENMNLQPI